MVSVVLAVRTRLATTYGVATQPPDAATRFAGSSPWWRPKPVLLMAALVAVAWVPAAVLSSAGISFPQAKICPANGADRELGDLLGETKEAVAQTWDSSGFVRSAQVRSGR